MAEEVEFTEEQQEFVNDLVGKTRVEAREKALEKAEQDKKDAIASVRKEMSASKGDLSEQLEEYKSELEELRPLREQVGSYQEVIEGLLESRIEELGEAAEETVADLPGGPVDKLNWLSKHEDLFKKESPVGTPRSQRGGGQGNKDDGSLGINVRL